MSRRGPNPPQAPWALEPGPEICEFCLGAYHVEMGYRCVECDAPICPLCVVEVRASRVVLCPDCSEGGR